MKRLTSLLLTIIMVVVSVAPITAFADTVTYIYADESEVQITDGSQPSNTEPFYVDNKDGTHKKTTYSWIQDGNNFKEEGTTVTEDCNYSQDTVKEANCQETGEIIYTCPCGHSYSEITPIKPDNHSWQFDKSTPATCTTRGTITYVCTVPGCDATQETASLTEPEPLGHVWIKTQVVEPTCTEDGYTLYVCSRCSEEEKRDITTAAHKYDAGKITTDSTETTTGLITYTCSVCGTTYTEVIPINSTRWVTYDGGSVFAPKGETPDNTPVKIVPDGEHKTHTMYRYYWDGHTEKCDTTTSDCSYSSAITTKPTCSTNGATTYTCSVCKDTYIVEAPLATGDHNYYEKITKEATCTEDGELTFVCESCGKTYSEPIEKLGHKYSETVVPPTCTEQGYTLHKCANCGDTYKDNYVAATGHTWDNGVVTKEATDTEDGEIEYTCKVCGKKDIKVIPTNGVTWIYYDGRKVITTQDATAPANTSPTYEKVNSSSHKKSTYSWVLDGDDYKEVKTDGEVETCDFAKETITKKPTCQDGERLYTCQCGNTKTEVIDATDQHQYTHKTTPATCTEDGVITYTCKVCGDTYTESITKLGHNYADNIIAPTCTTEGYTNRTCLRCGDTIEHINIVPPFGHDYHITKVVAPTCCKDGYTEKKCALCGDIIQDSVVPATEQHTYVVSSKTKATSSNYGYIYYKCSTDGCTATKRTTINKIKSYSISKVNIYYTGKNLTKPTVKVLDSAGKTISSSNYAVTYISRATNKSFSTLKGIGRYKVKITFKSTSNYSGSVYKYFSVIPKKETLRAVSTGKRYVSASWYKQSYASGYYVMIATNSKFTANKRTYTCSKNTKTYVKMASLKKGKRYYVKVCSYRNCKVDGKTQRVYGTYSAVKSIVCK